MRQQYYLRQKVEGGSFHVIFIAPLTGKQTDRTAGHLKRYALPCNSSLEM